MEMKRKGYLGRLGRTKEMKKVKNEKNKRRMKKHLRSSALSLSDSDLSVNVMMSVM